MKKEQIQNYKLMLERFSETADDVEIMNEFTRLHDELEKANDVIREMTRSSYIDAETMHTLRGALTAIVEVL